MTELRALRGRIVLVDSVIEDAVVVLDGELIHAIVDPAEWQGATPEAVGTLAPGFVDVHCHGGGGYAVTTGAPGDVRAVVRHHRERGTTSIVASLVSASADGTAAGLAAIASASADEPGLLGSHLEGPCLAAGHCGAHDPTLLALPTPGLVADWLGAAGGTLRMVTLAPELSGAREAADLLHAADVVVAAGHTDADAATFGAALASSSYTTVTHLFNGMAAFHHRAPGPAGAALRALGEGQIFAELIVDGTHLADETVALVFALAPDRVILVSDAMSAAGMPDGRYELGSLIVDVRDHLAWTTGAVPALAGSTIHLADAVRHAIVEVGVAPEIAIRAATATPAASLGLADRGRVASGLRADLVELTNDWHVTRVMQSGTWL